jgi:hypothetical protein
LDLGDSVVKKAEPGRGASLPAFFALKSRSTSSIVRRSRLFVLSLTSSVGSNEARSRARAELPPLLLLADALEDVETDDDGILVDFGLDNDNPRSGRVGVDDDEPARRALWLVTAAGGLEFGRL